MTINKDNLDINKNQSLDNFEDNYDYLDDLMSGLMENTSDETIINSSTNEENLVAKEANTNEQNEPEGELVNPGLQKRRTPLLAQFFQENNNDVEESPTIKGEIDIDITEINHVDTINQIDIENEIDNIKDKEVYNEEANEPVDEQVEHSAPANEHISKVKLKPTIDNKDNKPSFIKDWSGAFSEDEDEEYDKEEDEEDSFDTMFADLIDDENIEDIEDGLDPEVQVPLEKSGMNEIIVTRDGKSLAEVIPGLRGGRRRSEDILADIKEQKRIVQIENKKFSDNRYLKHVETQEEKMSDREKRIQLSQRFLQKHARFTEQEKTILNNLGLSSDEFSKIIKSQELTLKDKEEIIGLGRYGPEKHFKGKRYRTTLGDLAMLEFLVKFKFANTRILRWLSHESQNTTWQKLKRLENSGLVESQSIIGVPDLWGATTTGVGLAGYSLKPGLKPMPKMQTISATMGINYLAACLWFNTINVLNLEDFPRENRLIGLENGEFNRVRGEDLVSELEIRSSLGKEINPYSSTVQTLGDERLYDVISSNVRKEFEAWVSGGKQGLSPEFIPGNEYMWILYPMSQLTLSYHVPDLVVRRERGPNGEPRSIAVELERHTKTNTRYDKIMLAYKLDEHLYEKVIWVTPNARTARELDMAAQSVGFENYSIIPIITETGVYNKPDIWLI